MRPAVTMREDNALPHHIEKDRIRKVRTGAGARGEMEVAAHRNYRRNRGEWIERTRLIYIARMENSGDPGRRNDFRHLRWEHGEPVRDMRVRKNAKSNGLHGMISSRIKRAIDKPFQHGSVQESQAEASATDHCVRATASVPSRQHGRFSR